MNIFNIAIIGVGKMGGALALALSKKGYQISELVTRRYENAKEIAELIKPRPRILNSEELEKITAGVVFITTQDTEVPVVAANLAERLDHLPFVFHTSGALSSKVLGKLNSEGCEVASIHPLVSISNAKMGAKSFKDGYFCVEGDLDAVSVARQIIDDLGGTPFSIETKYKPLYHASAVMACGHLVALISSAVEMLSNCGLSRDEAQKILLPLIKSTVNNLSSQTPAEALTGTFARADAATLQKHLDIMQETTSEEIFEIYLQLGLRSLLLAQEQGVDQRKIKLMKDVLLMVNGE